MEHLLLNVLHRLAERRGGSVESFDDAGLLTRNSGVVVTMPDRSEFQITVVKSR